MSIKNFFALLLIFVIMPGCHFLDQSSPHVMTVPPYWQSQHQRMQDQLTDIRAFHEKESAEISEDMYIVRNREMERLEAAGKELEKERFKQEEDKATSSRRSGWQFGWFTKKS